MLSPPKGSGVLNVKMTNRSGSFTGGGRSRTAFTKLKIAVLAPIPSASERTATSVNPGDRRNPRRAYRISASTKNRRYHSGFRGEPNLPVEFRRLSKQTRMSSGELRRQRATPKPSRTRPRSAEDAPQSQK